MSAKLVKQVSFVIPTQKDDNGEGGVGGTITNKMRIRWKKISKHRMFSRKIKKDGQKILPDDGSEDDDDDEELLLLSSKKREDETLPDKLRRLVRYETLFAKYLDAHENDDDISAINGGSVNHRRQETLEGFIKRSKQGRQSSLYSNNLPSHLFIHSFPP